MESDSIETSVFRKGVVRIAVQPAFSGLRRGDYGMSACLCVPGGVAVGRTVTAQRRATALAGAQMDPAVTGLDAFVALTALCLFDGLNRADMSTK